MDRNNQPPPQDDFKKLLGKQPYDTLSKALIMSDFEDPVIRRISDLLNLDIDSNLSKQEYINEMTDQLEHKFGGIMSFIRRSIPGETYVFYSAMFVLSLGVVAEMSLRTRGASFKDYASLWYVILLVMITITNSIATTAKIVRNYLVTTSQSNILKIINLIKRSSKKELEELNHCLYMPLWRKVQHCKFNMKQWASQLFRGGWTIRSPRQLEIIKNRPFQEGLLEVLRLEKQRGQQ